MNHHSTWGHPPRKRKPSRGIPALFVIAIGMTVATLFAVLITGAP